MKNLLQRKSYFFLTLTLLLFTSFVYGGKVVLRSGDNNLRIIEDSYQLIKFQNSFSFFNIEEMKTPEGVFARLDVPQYVKRGMYGEPEFPVNSQFLEIPVGAEISVNILNASFKQYTMEELGINYPLYPHQAPVSKSDEQVDFNFSLQAYQTDIYYGTETVTVEYLGMMRGVNIARIDVSPIQYNPERKILRIYEELEFEVVFTQGDVALTENLKNTYFNPVFNASYSNIINFKIPASSNRDTISRYPIKYVIVSDPMFEDQLQPFIEWKRQKGFEVIEAYTDDPGVGTTTFQIKDYLQGLYDNATPDDPAPTYVLFVGDIDQVPTWTGQAAGHVTDLYYVEYTGDYFPEMYFGRFSAQNSAQLQPQIDKTLMYEQYTMDDPSYLEEVVMIAGMDGSFGPVHGNGQINYGTINYFNEDHDILSHTYLYPESGSSSAAIQENISDGVGFANYTAHGSPSGWADPSFTTSDIPSLQNEGMYGLLIGNCCSTSEFQVGECFGEAILRAEGKGALGYIGASNSTYWDEDYYFGVGVGDIDGNPPPYEETTLGNYDCSFHDHGEPFSDWYATMDQMIYAGNLAVTLGSPSMALYYWEAYCLMGDPSLMVYMGVPDSMVLTYDPLLPIGSSSFTVMAVPYAYVALSIDGDLLGAALADSTGEAVIPLEDVTVPGMADVVATAQNYQPYFGDVLIANPEGPYVLLNEVMCDDSIGGNDNGLLDNGENILFDTELKNWGNENAENVTASLILQDGLWLEIQDDFHEFGTVPAGDSIIETGAFAVQVQDSIQDLATVSFEVLIEDDGREVWSSNFFVTLFAPVLQIDNITVVDTLEGNGNGRIDPGETVDLYLMAGNNGHCDAMDAMTSLSSTSPYVTINLDSCLMDTLAWGNMYPMHFNISVSEEISTGDYIDLSFLTTAMPYSLHKDFMLPVGLVIEDFESGDLTSFGWMTSGNQPWIVQESEVYEGLFSAMSGDIDDQETTELYLDMEVFNADSISFYRKVSCEDDPYGTDYDWLAFYIDNTEMDRWDGEVEWSGVAYPVTEGTHTFKWVYSKDYSVSVGADAAWIDFIIFPGVPQSVSVDEISSINNMSLKLFPNPASQQAYLYFELMESSNVTIRVMDLMGRPVSTSAFSGMLDAGQHSIDLDVSSLSTGIYLLSVETPQGRIIKKIIKN